MLSEGDGKDFMEEVTFKQIILKNNKIIFNSIFEKRFISFHCQNFGKYGKY